MKERSAFEVLAVKGEKHQNISRSNRVSTYGQDWKTWRAVANTVIFFCLYKLFAPQIWNLLHALSYLVSAITRIDSRSKRTYLGKPGPQILKIKESPHLCVRDTTNACS